MQLPPNMTDYERTRREFRLEVPEFFNFTTDVVEAWARRERDRVALVIASADGHSFESHTFDDLRRRANQFAHLLLRRGARKGDRVLVMLPRIHEWYAALLGMFKIGVIPMPATPLCKDRDLEYRLMRAGAVGVVTDAAHRSVMEAATSRVPSIRWRLLVDGGDSSWDNLATELPRQPEDLTPPAPTRSSDPMILYFTSGTEGFPKIVVHTQASYGIAHRLTATFWQDVHPQDMQWTLTDTGWAKAAWGAMFGQWSLGARVFLHNSPRFEPRLTLDLLARSGVSVFCAPPTAYRMMIQEDLGRYSWPTLRHCVSAGEPLNPEAIRVWQAATGLGIHDGYGQTETVNVLANYRCLPVRIGAMGKPVPGYEVAVVDEDGSVLPPDEEGPLAIRVRPTRPVGLFGGYEDDAAACRQCFRGDWYYTGDKARVDADGYFWFVGRADDVIGSSGYRIGPFEIESALLEHPAVKESAVVGSPDPVRGEVIKAFVVLAAGHTPSAELANRLQEHVRKVTAPYKYPRLIEFVESLPKTVSGKIRRGELKQREYAAVQAAQAAAAAGRPA